MEIKFYGGNCLKFSTKKTSVAVDDIVHLGGKSQITDKDIQLVTDDRTGDASQTAKFVIAGPGEYEVSDVSVVGLATRAHMDDEKSGKLATIYRVIVDDIRIAVIGHIYPDLTEEQLEVLGTIDILTIPVGGNGYTLDGIGAQKIIRKIEPKIVIPTHYSDKTLNFEVPQTDLETALKAVGMEPAETVDVLKVKGGEMSEVTKLIVINRK